MKIWYQNHQLWGEHKCRILDIHLKWKDHQLQTILFIYILLYQNLMVTTNWRIDTYIKEKASKHNTKFRHQITREKIKKSQEKRRGREEKRLTKQIQNNALNVSKNIHVDNYLKGKWIKCFNQKTQTGWMDTKTCPIYMLHTKDPPSDLGTYTIESKRMEKGILCKWSSKEARIAILISHKINFKIS